MDLPTEPETLTFDIRGQICPATLLVTLRELNTHRERLRSGTLRLVFLTDNRASTSTIPAALTNMGYRVAVDRDGPHYTLSVGGGER